MTLTKQLIIFGLIIGLAAYTRPTRAHAGRVHRL
jgi:hypothetical protein